MDDAYTLAAYEANVSPSFSPIAKGTISADLV